MPKFLLAYHIIGTTFGNGISSTESRKEGLIPLRFSSTKLSPSREAYCKHNDLIGCIQCSLPVHTNPILHEMDMFSSNFGFAFRLIHPENGGK